LMLTFPKRG